MMPFVTARCTSAAGPRRLLTVWGCAAATVATTASAQVRVSGRVVEEGSATPIGGAVVRITGSDSTMTTGASGTFTFGKVISGRLVLTVAAPAYQLQSIPLELYRDTVLTIIMKRLVAKLDPMVVRPRDIRIKGSVVDSVTGDPILFAQVGFYPDGRFVAASNIGKFSLDKVNAGDITVVVEAMEYVPTIVRLNALRDTTIMVRMQVDSVAIRMLQTQVTRLADRADGIPYVMRAYDRDLIAREGRASVGDLVDRIMMVPSNLRVRAQQSAAEACVFYDDRRIPPGQLDGMYPELVERVEVYNHGAMIRVYSKRYVMSLVAQSALHHVLYMPTGLHPTCD